ncbi:MAG: Nif3-like dinuclear metal center hexameric protein [Thiohalocapsa sp. PB-PSB1]|nr:MAG: Nif3-like dinuclear metal center hexameric protein [Thiohalocapsa sp. PB-PSB1]HCS88908.1 Nif3-like dinuclear metal center hexameric protein [Chromatiaceae bacterium]
MITAETLARYSNELLSVGNFSDYCPNGLQVAGERPVRLLVSGVSASQALVQAAIDADADALLVHHGWFWKGEEPCLVGIKGRRVRMLMQAGIALLAYHLPLDAHPQLGNNRQLAEVLGINDPRPANPDGLLWLGRLAIPCSGIELARSVGEHLNRAPLHIAAIDRPVQHLAWCTGAAQRYIGEAHALGADLFISGEVSEQTTHEARELGIDYLGAGHHATERYGVQALGAHLADQFEIQHRFIDRDNPV